MLPAARVSVSFSPLKGEFIGRDALWAQWEEINARENGYPLPPKEERIVPKSIVPILITGEGIARRGFEVFAGGKLAGHVTSGTMVPYWKWDGQTLTSQPTDQKDLRSICPMIIII